MVAAMCSWHTHHAPARAEIERRLHDAETLLVAAPALVETYSVLTRLPPPHRLSAADALTLLEANFMSQGKIVALEAKSYRTLLRKAPRQGIAGGRTYDAIIAECARRAKATTLLTFNISHFMPFAGTGLDIVVPGQR
jgi:predicted nucleic acid-binding protein